MFRLFHALVTIYQQQFVGEPAKTGSVMINGVSRWRCKCGVSIKVLTETDNARINEGFKLEVLCPKCGDKQMVCAHRAVQVTMENPNEREAPTN